ncbi:MAG: Uma2 family endonuclease [Leptolyngbya sp. SIO1D8]|nr:Uma2 family endonuclease [Leptolyngbya sp. SIO1D8]
MVSADPLVKQPVPQPIGEQRVVLRSITWQGYLAVRQSLSPDRNTHLTYSEGTLEITMPLEIHEFSAWLIGRFIYILASELGMKLKTMGSTTLEREVLERSSEPDAAYYIQHQPLVTGRDVDLEKDPPPDLVVEVDITHTDIDKLRLYASLGVPEFWRYNGEVWRVYCLQGDRYLEAEVSSTFPQVPKAKLYEFLETARLDEMEADRVLRNWVRALPE